MRRCKRADHDADADNPAEKLAGGHCITANIEHLSPSVFHGNMPPLHGPASCPVSRIRAALARSRVVALVGPRQCGKTTLAHALARAAHELLRSGRPPKPDAAHRADDGARRPEGADRDRRGTASPRSIPGPESAGRPAAAARALSHPGQRIASVVAAVDRVARRQDRDHRDGGFRFPRSARNT